MFFLTLISHTRAPQIRRVILCQAAYFEKSRTRSTLIPKTAVFPRLTRLLCSAIKAQIQSGEIVFLRRGFLSFCGRTPVASTEKKAQNTAANFKALGQRGHHATLSALIRSRCLLIRKMRTPHFRGNACKNAILPRFIGLYLMCPQHRNARRARSCIVVHFTCPLVALRFEGTFHVFALAKTFHFCAEDMLASCSLLSAQKFHVRSKGARFRTLYIVPLRRT